MEKLQQFKDETQVPRLLYMTIFNIEQSFIDRIIEKEAKMLAEGKTVRNRYAEFQQDVLDFFFNNEDTGRSKNRNTGYLESVVDTIIEVFQGDLKEITDEDVLRIIDLHFKLTKYNWDLSK